MSNNYIFLLLSPCCMRPCPKTSSLRSGGGRSASSLGFVCGIRPQSYKGITATTISAIQYGYNRVCQGKTSKQSGSSVRQVPWIVWFRSSGWIWGVCMDCGRVLVERGPSIMLYVFIGSGQGASVGPCSSESSLVRAVTLLERGIDPSKLVNMVVHKRKFTHQANM